MKGIFLNAEFYIQKGRKYHTDGLIHFYQGEEKTTVGESKLPNTGILLCFAKILMLQSHYSLSAQHRKPYTGIDAYIFFNSA